MSNTYSNLKFEIIEVGGNDGTWGPIVNTNVGTAIEQAIVGMATLITSDFSTNICTLTLTNTNAAQNARAACLNITATLTGAATLNVPAIQKPYIILNNSVGGFAVTVKVSGLTGVAIPAGKACVVYNNGTDVVDAINYMSSLTLGTDLALTEGGTGASSASGARTNLGATTLGGNLFTITNPSAVTFPRFNADNTVSALDATAFRTAIGAGSGTGSVSDVTASAPLASSGGATPNITLSGALPIANGGTGNITGVAVSAPLLQTTNFTISEVGGLLVFKYGATTIARMDSSGNLTTLANVTAYGTP
jgi:energy-converting hydrogenase Eha subunit E